MVRQESIPDDVRWQIAAQFAAQLPALYDRTFRPVVGDGYDDLEQEIWMEVAQIAFDAAKNLSLPVGTAQELAESVRTILGILFGPEFRSETLELSKDSAVILVRHCPFLSAGIANGTDGNRTFRRCMAFTLTANQLLNKGFSTRFVRTLCTGDRQCEIKIAQREPDAKAMKK